MNNQKDFLARLPDQPGVYQMLDEKGKVLYVGKASNLKKRVSSYFVGHHHSIKTNSLVKRIRDIDITVTRNEVEAILLECNLIKQYRPHYNVLLRDDKSYSFIALSQQNHFPRLYQYRGTRRKQDLYFGPYPSGSVVRETIRWLQKLFYIRTCSDSFFAHRLRPCLLYQMHRCTAPCVQLISKTAYAEYVKQAVLFLKGKNDELVTLLNHKMHEAVQGFHYELAAKYRDQMMQFQQMSRHQATHQVTGEMDIIGFAKQSGLACIQRLSIRSGQVVDSRCCFLKVPKGTEDPEIVSSFLMQYYFDSGSNPLFGFDPESKNASYLLHHAHLPREIILAAMGVQKDLLEKGLQSCSEQKVSLLFPKRGQKKRWLIMATHSAAQALTTHIMNKTNLVARCAALEQALGLKKRLQHIECFDISHTAGCATVASCVVFNRFGPQKQFYRRFNLDQVQVKPGDDMGAIYQAVWRRFKRLQAESHPFPDLVLIDGGDLQLSAAIRALESLCIQDILLIGVAKGAARRPGQEVLHFTNKTIQSLPPDSLSLHFIQQIRDEAHRFALEGHRKRRDKLQLQSVLERIPGVGAQRRKNLLCYFGGIQGITHASLEELVQVHGISRLLAKRIFETLHHTVA